jgi:hypothetical protein
MNYELSPFVSFVSFVGEQENYELNPFVSFVSFVGEQESSL